MSFDVILYVGPLQAHHEIFERHLSEMDRFAVRGRLVLLHWICSAFDNNFFHLLGMCALCGVGGEMPHARKPGSHLAASQASQQPSSEPASGQPKKETKRKQA